MIASTEAPNEQIARRKTRNSTSKVRTGCITCKSRRVKCDEQKPICRRCENGDRRCEYSFDQPRTATRVQNIVTIYVPPVKEQPNAIPASFGVDFYHRNIAFKFSGPFDSDFWGTLILQLSQSEPVIRHALSAISAAYRDMDEAPTNTLVLQECSTAMRSLSARIKNDPTSHLIPLVACILFTCLEFIRGNVDSAMTHMLSGFKILSSSRQPTSLTNDQREPECIESMSIEKHIVPVLSRLNIVCLLFGKILPPIYSNDQRANSTFTTLVDARRRLYEVMDQCLRFIKDTASKSHTFDVVQEDHIQQLELQCELQQWHNRLEEMLSSLNQSEQAPIISAISLLRIQHRTIYIWLSVCLSAEESVVDAHTAGFAEIVDLGTKVTQSNQSASDDFSFEMQMIAPLYYTAIKCRVPSIRRRALNLLHLAPRREGLWSAHISIKLAERVIEIEERGLMSNVDPFLNSCCLESMILPAEKDRLQRISELPGECRAVQKNIVTPSLSDKMTVTFQTKPWGSTGPWSVFQEDILL